MPATQANPAVQGALVAAAVECAPYDSMDSWQQFIALQIIGFVSDLEMIKVIVDGFARIFGREV